MVNRVEAVDLQTSKFFHGVRNPIVNLSLLTIGLLWIVKVLNPQVETSKVMRSPLKKDMFLGESRKQHVLVLWFNPSWQASTTVAR